MEARGVTPPRVDISIAACNGLQREAAEKAAREEAERRQMEQARLEAQVHSRAEAVICDPVRTDSVGRFGPQLKIEQEVRKLAEAQARQRAEAEAKAAEERARKEHIGEH